MRDSKRIRRTLLVGGLGALTMSLRDGARAQDPVRVMPKTYRIAFENDHVRVLEFTARPGMGICGDGMHSHPPGLTIALTDWQGVGSTEQGAPKPRKRSAGDVSWHDAITHKVENTGRANARVLIVDLKALDRKKG